MTNAVVWCDIPVLDLSRASRFYSAVLGADVSQQEFSGMKIALLPHQGQSAGGCLYSLENEKPSDHGPLVYLNADGRLDQAIAAVTANGGKVLMPKHAIGPHGFRAVILDSEGNRIALHSK